MFSYTIGTMARKKIEVILITVVFQIIFCLPGMQKPGFASGSIEQFQVANNAYIALARDAALRKDKNNWLKVVKKYDAVAREYPSSNLAPKAVYMKGKLYEQIYGYFSKKTDLEAALNAYQSVVKKYPDSTIADDALYKQAKLYEVKLGDKEKAIEIYREVVTIFPKADMAQQAREALNTFNIEAEEWKQGEKEDQKGSRKTVQGEKDLKQIENDFVLVKGVRQWADNDYTRIVIDVNRCAAFDTFTLPPDLQSKRAQRLVMDLNNAKMAQGLPAKMEVNDGILNSIRISQNRKDIVRIVMDLAAQGSYKAFPLENPFRIVVDVSSKTSLIIKNTEIAPSKRVFAKNDAGIRRVKAGIPSRMPSEVPSIAKQLSLKVSRIVIDPGHGGKDPGAIGPDGEKEKDITLSISKVLAKRLRDEGFDVFLTREGDTFIPLEERTAYANKKKADLFVSVHVNAHEDVAVRGVETYILNLTTDASAIQVAARENATTSKSLSDLQFIINDLMLTSKINESSRFATSTQKSIISSLGKSSHTGKDLGVKQAPFYVLIGAQMPSILVEIGFITNANECSLLQSETYQTSIIDGIVSGINFYIANTTYAYNGRNS